MIIALQRLAEMFYVCIFTRSAIHAAFFSDQGERIHSSYPVLRKHKKRIIDIFSCGIVFFILLNQYFPNDRTMVHQCLLKIVIGSRTVKDF